MVTRHILEQSRRNGADLANFRSDLTDFKKQTGERFDRLERRFDKLERKVDTLRKDPPAWSARSCATCCASATESAERSPARRTRNPEKARFSAVSSGPVRRLVHDLATHHGHVRRDVG